MFGVQEFTNMSVYWIHMDSKKQVKVHYVNETTHRSLPWCPGAVPFSTIGKSKGYRYIDGYGHKTPNSTKIAVSFVCQNVLKRAQKLISVDFV